MEKVKNKKGVAVLYVVFVVSVLLGISFGISGILIPQIRMLGDIGYSVVALYAADSGIDKFLVDRQNPNLASGHYNGSLPNGATYAVSVIQGGSPGCPSPLNFCIRSIGIYRDVRRAIEINY